MRPYASQRLKRFYEQFSGTDSVLIMINADPDAIASAMAVKRLLWRKVSGVAISNINVIKRPDNLAMIRLMGLDMIHIGDIDRQAFKKFVIVDSQPNHNEAFAGIDFHVIIDHHPDTNIKAPFVDIRPKFGATATIMTEYIRAARIKPSTKLATAMFHAIKADTHNFEREALIEDIRAFQFMFQHANIHLARKIEQADLRLDFLKYFKKAFDDMLIRRSRAFIHLGDVMNPDICVIIADFFMRFSSVKWSIVSGFYDNRMILVFRNDGIRKNAGSLAKSSFGTYGSAGGHKSMARAEVTIDMIQSQVDLHDPKAVLWWIINQIEKNYKTTNKSFSKDGLGLQL